MRIDSASIFTFYFPYEGHEIAIPVRAASREEACQKLLNFFAQWGLEVSLETPKMSAPLAPSPAPTSAGLGPNPFVLELDIEALVREITPMKKPKGANTVDKLVRDWTGFTYEPQNYPAIISELQRIKNAKE